VTFFHICLDGEALFLTVARGIPALFAKSPRSRSSFFSVHHSVFSNALFKGPNDKASCTQHVCQAGNERCFFVIKTKPCWRFRP
jgi:hypothetical protein